MRRALLSEISYASETGALTSCDVEVFHPAAIVALDHSPIMRWPSFYFRFSARHHPRVAIAIRGNSSMSPSAIDGLRSVWPDQADLTAYRLDDIGRTSTIRARWSCIGTWEVYDSTDVYWRAACPTLYADLGPLDVPSCRCTMRASDDRGTAERIEVDRACWYHGDPAAHRLALAA